MLRPWEEFDASTWREVMQEARGRRVKSWVAAPNGDLWLRKEPRDSRPSEPAIEALMLRLAHHVGVQSAEGSVCEWDDNGERKRGLIVRLFLDRAQEHLALGSELLKQQEPTYDPEAKWAHTLHRVRTVLVSLAGETTELTVGFAHMVTFDAWIGNADRHQENWGILARSGTTGVRLAPMFDPAACLGTELLDGNPRLDPGCPDESIEEYVLRCPSGFGDGTAPVRLADVVRELGEWPEWRENVSA